MAGSPDMEAVVAVLRRIEGKLDALLGSGRPKPDSVVEEIAFTPTRAAKPAAVEAAPAATAAPQTYLIRRTTQVDPNDDPIDPAKIASLSRHARRSAITSREPHARRRSFPFRARSKSAFPMFPG
jgi:hypothetical protein